MNARRRSLALLALATGMAIACHENPAAPVTTYSTVTVALDTINYGAINNSFGGWYGTTALVSPAGFVSVLAWDNFNGLLRYHGCADACDNPASWKAGTVEAGTQPLWQDAIGNGALTSTGVHFVYQNSQGLRYLSCPGSCDVATSWTGTGLFPGHAFLGYGEATSLAADVSGRLHLLFSDPTDSTLHYASCAGDCLSPSSWQEVLVDAGRIFQDVWLITVAPDGAAHAFYQTIQGWMHATCTAGCAAAGHWRAEIVDPAWSVVTASGAFGPDGRLHVVWAHYDYQVRYATCASPCTPPAKWSVTALPDSGYVVSLAADRQGRLLLATSWHTVDLTSCVANCLDPASWQPSALVSPLGRGEVSVALDAAGRPLVASSYGGFPTVLQYSETQ